MTNAEILTRALRGKATIRERQRSLTKEHTERTKKFEALIEKITSAEINAQLELGGTGGIDLAPDLADLLENPTVGL